MNLLELYQLHINPDADGLELFDFFFKFDISILVLDIHPQVRKYQEEQEEKKRIRATDWIFKNSKL